MQSVSAGVIAAQQVLRITAPGLRVDGMWGPKTTSVYRQSTPSVQMGAKDALAAHGLDVKTFVQDGGESGPEVLAAIRRAADETGESYAVLLTIAKTESSLNPKAINGSSRGLGQFQATGWAASATKVKLPPYDTSWSDPYYSALAIAGYLKINRGRLLAGHFSDPITPAVQYLAHQQGAAGVIELWNASRGIKSTTDYVSEAHMLRNPPPDGQPPTRDKAAFYTRWINVMNHRFSS